MDVWNQAFKWSTSMYQPDTDPNHKRELKPLSKEDFEFLEKAFESIMINETKEFIKCLNIIIDKKESTKLIVENSEISDTDKENAKIEYETICLSNINKMQEYCDGLEVSRNITRCKKFKEVIQLAFSETNLKIQLQLLRLLGLMLQNDMKVQQDALNHNIFYVLGFLKESKSDSHDYKLKENSDLVDKALYVLCGLIYGECIESRLSFVIDQNGFEILTSAFNEVKNKRIIQIIQDLTKPEDEPERIKLNKTILDNFSKNDMFDKTIKWLEDDFETDVNEVNSFKINLFQILTNTSHIWTSEQYTKYNEFYKKILNLSLKEKKITDEELKQLIRDQNSSISQNYKNRKVEIKETPNIVHEYEKENNKDKEEQTVKEEKSNQMLLLGD